MKYTIPLGASAGDPVAIGPHPLVGILVPASFEGNQIAVHCGPNTANVAVAHDAAGTAIVFSVGSSRYVAINPLVHRLRGAIKLISQTTGVAENQTTTAAELLLVTDPCA
jgi:hypothetical protein